MFQYNKTNQFNKEDVKVELPTNCLYQDVVFKYTKSAGSSKLLSDIHHILNIIKHLHKIELHFFNEPFFTFVFLFIFNIQVTKF